jgi:hypothetical protein
MLACGRNRNNFEREETTVGSLHFTRLGINPKKFKSNNRIASLSQLPSHLKVSTFANSIDYIPLETNDTVLIGEIDKIIKRADKLFVMDKMTGTIFCFNSEGKFLYKLMEKGNGPGEYYSIGDFNVTENEEIVIYSSSQGLLFYNEDGFIRKINSSIIAENFYLDKDTVWFHVGRFPNEPIFKEFPKQYRLVKTVNNKIIGEYLPYKSKDYYLQIPVSRNSFFIFQDTLNLVDHLNQETYSIVNGEVTGKYKFEFTTNKETFNYNNSEAVNNSIFEKINKGDYTRLSSYLESDNYIFADYAIEGFIMHAYITKKDFEFNNVGLFYFDDFNDISFGGSMMSIEGNTLIATMEPANLLALTKKTDKIPKNMQAIRSKTDPSDNPIIIILDLK